MDTGLLLTRGTAMVAFVLYVLALAQRFRHSWSRVWWTAGAGVFLVHVLCAFHFVHHWSHTDAYAATARQTYALAGFDWGGGVYFNYVFTALWVADAVWWWVSPVSHYSRPKAITYVLHGFMAFMWFNGTVVFGGMFARWAGFVGFLIVGSRWLGESKEGEKSRLMRFLDWWEERRALQHLSLFYSPICWKRAEMMVTAERNEMTRRMGGTPLLWVERLKDDGLVLHGANTWSWAKPTTRSITPAELLKMKQEFVHLFPDNHASAARYPFDRWGKILLWMRERPTVMRLMHEVEPEFMTAESAVMRLMKSWLDVSSSATSPDVSE